MFKFLLILGLIVLVWSLASKKRTRADAPPPVARPEETMVCCAHCGVHLPASDSIVAQGRFYCCEAHRQAGWVAELQQRARIETIITDPYTDPLLDASTTLGPSYRSVMRINSLAAGWHPTSTDHNGNSAHRLLERIGCPAGSFADFAAGMEQLVATMGSRHQVALKNALAYDRDLHFALEQKLAARKAACGQAACGCTPATTNPHS